MKKTGIILLSIITLLFMGIDRLSAQQNNVFESEWNFVLGDWIGEGSGTPGEGAGWFTFKKENQGAMLVRYNHTVFPAMNGKPEVIHDDVLYIHLDHSGSLTKGLYLDNEQHIINYDISYNQADKSLIFISEIKKDMPRFRLTYKALGSNTLSIDFEIAPPNQPEAFSKYISGKALRKTPSEKLK